MNSSATTLGSDNGNSTAGERAQRHCMFLNQCANYFEGLARVSKEDITVQAHHSNARNLIAAANFIAVLMSERTPAVNLQD